MVYEYGMGTSIRSHQVPANDWNVSEMMRQRRDEEVNEISEEAYRGAHRLLTTTASCSTRSPASCSPTR